MIARFVARQRSVTFFIALLNELIKAIANLLFAHPEMIERVMGEEPLPAHWTEPFEEHFPTSLRQSLRATAKMFAQRIAGKLVRSRFFRDRYNRDIDRAETDEEAAREDLDDAAAAIRRIAQQLPQGVFDLASCLNEMRLQRRRLRYSLFSAGAWFGGAGIGMLGEVLTIAAAAFQLLERPDFAQKIATWTGALSTAVALTFAGEKGLRPLVDPEQRARLNAGTRWTVTCALTLLMVLAAVLGAVRASAAGQGGASDALQFMLAFISTPFLALISSHCITAGEFHRAKANAARQRLAELEEARVRIDSLTRRREAAANQRAAAQADASRSAEDADRRAAEAEIEKQRLLRDTVRSVTGSADIRTIIAKFARDAADLNLPTEPPAGHGPVSKSPAASNGAVPKSRANIVSLTLVLLPLLAGCGGDAAATFGGTPQRSGVGVILDRTASGLDFDALKEEARREFARFESEPTGSKFELWATAMVPGRPALIHDWTVPRTLPRDRKRISAAAVQELNAKLDALQPLTGAEWSAILEDSHRVASRLSSMDLERRRVVVLSDLQQHTPFLKLAQITNSKEPDKLVSQVIETYPVLSAGPDVVTLVGLPGNVGGGQLPSPASYERLKSFWRKVWSSWSAKEIESREPAVLSIPK